MGFCKLHPGMQVSGKEVQQKPFQVRMLSRQVLGTFHLTVQKQDKASCDADASELETTFDGASQRLQHRLSGTLCSTLHNNRLASWVLLG